jgi:hypothetical protein
MIVLQAGTRSLTDTPLSEIMRNWCYTSMHVHQLGLFSSGSSSGRYSVFEGLETG